MNMNIQEFAKELLRGDWTACMSDDVSEWSRQNEWEKKMAVVAEQLGHNGKRLWELANSYYGNFSSTPSGDEWRFAASILWVYGIKMSEQEVKDKFVDGPYIRWAQINKEFPDFSLTTY
jgi:hypothetical protein